MSDVDQAFAKSIDWSNGARPKRFAIIVDHGKVTYAEKDDVPRSIANTGIEAVVAKL